MMFLPVGELASHFQWLSGHVMCLVTWFHCLCKIVGALCPVLANNLFDGSGKPVEF